MIKAILRAVFSLLLSIAILLALMMAFVIALKHPALFFWVLGPLVGACVLGGIWTATHELLYGD